MWLWLWCVSHSRSCTLFSPAPTFNTQPNEKPLHTAAYNGNKRCVALLLLADDSILQVKNKGGNTPTDYARGNDQPDTAAALEKWASGDKIGALRDLGAEDLISSLPASSTTVGFSAHRAHFPPAGIVDAGCVDARRCNSQLSLLDPRSAVACHLSVLATRRLQHQRQLQLQLLSCDSACEQRILMLQQPARLTCPLPTMVENLAIQATATDATCLYVAPYCWSLGLAVAWCGGGG